MGPVSSAPTVAASSGGSPGGVARRPRLPGGVSAPASIAPVEVPGEPGPFLPLVEQPVATHTAEELAGLERFRELLVWGGGRWVHGRNVVHRSDTGTPSP